MVVFHSGDFPVAEDVNGKGGSTVVALQHFCRSETVSFLDLVLFLEVVLSCL